jgi:hypothetical protein
MPTLIAATSSRMGEPDSAPDFSSVGHGHEGAGDRCRARAPVGLDDVAVHPDRPLAELRHLDHRAQ